VFLGIPWVRSLILINNHMLQGKRPIIPRKERAGLMVRVENQVKKVRLHVIVAFFIGRDCKGGDMLCGHSFCGYTSIGVDMSRACNCLQLLGGFSGSSART
jgi:hypothetical protein